MEKKEKKVYTSSILNVETYISKDGSKKFSYIVIVAKWNDEKKKYDGYKLDKVSSNIEHEFGETIMFTQHKNRLSGEYFYKEVENTETVS